MNTRLWTLVLAITAIFIPAAAASAPPADPARGKALFETCAACHSAVLGEALGPDLHGVLGRKAGSAAGFQYSAALQGSGTVWDEPALRAFLQNPQKAVPGNRMAFPGYDNPADVDAVIDYLETLR
jgi:cytochrome c